MTHDRTDVVPGIAAPRVDPPRDAAELLGRARALEGIAVDELARLAGVRVDGAPVSTKGKVGELLERVLGASGGSAATWDFPDLAVELKTIPVDARGAPTESTFVCAVSLLDAERAEWETSWARAKLSRVLWVPVLAPGLDEGARRVGAARLWSPSSEQDAVLQGDFDEILGRIAASGIEDVTARVGRWLQLRPKAAHGRVRTRAPGGDEGDVATVPRGFYLRSRFTGAILRDPLALPA
ncbi:MAG TPA: DNA mismatch repair protein MutH [Polyangiaceae bacterium]|jgi:DNA mismatch repair protein MutH|nr:DNA mismatch repair protein MutH [Polyangiaceae bacterium]